MDCCDHARPIYFESAAQIDATPAVIRRKVLEGNKISFKLCSGNMMTGKGLFFRF